MANLYYYLGHHPWDAKAPEPCYVLPPKCVGSVDLRNLSDQATPNAETEPSFFACTEPLDSAYHLLGRGDCREILRSDAVVDTWETITRFRPTGNTLAEMLWDHLTSGSDPDGAERVKPLMPTTRGMLELHLGGHSLVQREKFHIDHHPHGNRVRSLLKRDFRRMFEHANRSGAKKREQEHPRKVLDFWCEKYGISADRWREFVPSDLQPHIPGVLKHETTITESFNTADSDTLGPDLSWTELSGDWDIVSNAAVYQSETTAGNARANSDLSSDDHYVQCTISDVGTGGDSGGVLFRKDSSTTETFYYVVVIPATPAVSIYKSVSGTRSSLNGTNQSLSFPDDLKGSADGSTIASFLNGTSIASVTDSAITGNLRTGIRSYRDTALQPKCKIDAFEAADIAASAGIIYTQLERTTRGMFRGIYTGGGS